MKFVKLLKIGIGIAIIGFGYLLGTAKIGEGGAAELSVDGKPNHGAVYRLRDAPGLLILTESRWVVFLGYGGDTPQIAIAPNDGCFEAFGGLYRLRLSPILFLSQGIEPWPDWDAKAKWEDDGASFTIPGAHGGRVHVQFKLADETT